MLLSRICARSKLKRTGRRASKDKSKTAAAAAAHARARANTHRRSAVMCVLLGVFSVSVSLARSCLFATHTRI